MSSHDILPNVLGAKKSDDNIYATSHTTGYDLRNLHAALASIPNGHNENFPSRQLQRNHTSAQKPSMIERMMPGSFPSQNHSPEIVGYSLSTVQDHRGFMPTRGSSNNLLPTYRIPDTQVASDSDPLHHATSSPIASLADPTRRTSVTQKRPCHDPDSLLRFLGCGLQAKTHRRNSPLEKIVTRHSLAGIWNEACLETFIDLMKPGFDYNDIDLIREEYLQTLSILVDIGWLEWGRFAEIFLNPDAVGEGGRSDRMIPTYTLAILEDESFLGPPWAEKFLASQYTFYPIDIQEGRSLVLSKEWRLPFTNDKPLNIGEGGYGQVTKEVIGRGHFRSGSDIHPPGAPYNKEIPVARKRFSVKGHFRYETKNLEILRSSLSQHHRIAPFLATVAIGNEFNILSPLASMDLEAFLLSGHQNIPDLKVHDLIQESAKLAGALAYLHKGLDGDIPGLSCWHMDLKPENILVFHGDTPEFPKVGKWKISDFGISIITGPKETGTIVTVTEFVDALTQRQKAMRPPGPYQPPDGDSFGPRSDVWSLGCILTRVLALGLEGGTGLTQLDELRKTDVDGVSLYENDYFYRGSPAVLNPHIQDWLDRLPHHHANYNFEFLGGCRSLILSMLEIDQEARPYAYEVQEQLHKLMNNAQRTLSCYSRSADTDGHAGSIGLDSVDSESSKRKVEYLMHAIDLGDLEEAGSWLRQGVNVEEKDERPERPLINAIQTGFVQAVELLLDHRRDLDLETPNSAGDTPLKIAAESGNTELVKILLTAGAIVDNPSRRGFTPLMSACRHGHEPAVQALLSRAANCSLHSHDGYTSLHYATFSRDGAKIIKLLSERLTSLGIPRDIPKADNGETPLLTLSKNYADTPFWWKMLDALLKGGIDINKADMNGTTPLYYAVGRECSKLVARLVSEGARWERNSLPSHLSSDMNKALKGTALKVMNPRRNSQGSYGSSRKSLSSQLRRMSTFRS